MWQLARGPVSLAFLVPYVESALSNESGLVRLQDTVLTWDGEERSLDVRAIGLDFLDADGRPLAQVPEASIRFSASALLRGLIAPTSLEVRRARLRLTRGADGAVEFGVESLAGGSERTTAGTMAPLVRELLNPPDRDRQTGYLTELRIVDATIDVIDHAAGTRWSARRSNIALSRDSNGIVADLSMEVAAAGRSGILAARGAFDSTRETTDLAVTLVGFPTRILTELEPRFAAFDRFDMALDGIVTATVDRAIRVQAAAFDLRSGPGTIDLPELTAAPVRVDRFAARGRIDQNLARLIVEDGLIEVDGQRARLAATVERGDSGTVVVLNVAELMPPMLARAAPELAVFERIEIHLAGTVRMTLDESARLTGVAFDVVGGAGPVTIPQFFPEPVPVTSLVARGRVDGNFERFVIEEAVLTSRGLQGTVSVDAQRSGETLTIQVDAAANDVPIDDIDPFWPRGLEEDARLWVTHNLTDGTVHRATIRVNAISDGGEVTVTGIGGEMAFSGVSAHYLRPMEPVVGAAGSVTFDQARLDINVEPGTGRTRELTVEEGRVNILGLDGGDKRADVLLTVAGPVRDALIVLDQEPLHYMREFGLDPTLAGGQQRANLVFDLPLRPDATIEDIGVAAAASIVDFAHPAGFQALPISDGRLTLAVDKTRLSIDGQLRLSGMPVEVSQLLNFTPEGVTDTRYQIRGVLEAEDRRRLGIGLGEVVSGPIGYGLAFTSAPDGSGTGSVELDLSAAAIDVAPFDWRKPAGLATRGFVEFQVHADAPPEITRFDVQARNMVAVGSLTLREVAGATVPARLTFERLIFDESDLFGTIDWAPDGTLDVRVGGNALDLRRVIAAGLDSEDGGAKGPGLRVTISESAPLLSLRLGQLTRLHNVVARMEHDGTVWRNALVIGVLGNDGGAVDIRLTDKGTSRTLVVGADNAGAVISALGWTENLRGGRLDVDAQILDSEPGRPLVGQAIVQDFQVIQAPVLARLLTLASLSAIVDTLNGEGIAFDRLVVPFRLTNDRIEINDARMRGSELGILAGGEIDRSADTIELLGEVAPAYTLNSLLGRIPLIGDVFTGGGDGVFAATYKVDGAVNDPRVLVNPLSVLTPGFTRRLLTGFSESLPDGQPTREFQEPWERPDQ